MPSPIYVKYTGENQGHMDGWGSWPGEDDQEGREGYCLVQKFEHEISVPRDPQSGLPSGRRVHKPVCITQRINKASPMLAQAMCQGERFSEVEFKWFRTDAAGMGGQVNYYTTTLIEAVLVSIRDWFPLTADQAKSNYSHFQDLCFTYRKIIWSWDGGTETEDDWKAG